MNVISSANTTTAAAVKKTTSAINSPEGAEPTQEVLSQVKDSIDSIDISAVMSKAGNAAKIAGAVAKHASRSVPGVLNVALNSPNLVASPILNAIDPATNNRDAIFYERWGNVLGGSALGGIAGAVLTSVLATDASVGQIIGVGFAGFAGGGALGGAKSMVTSWWTPTVYDGGATRTVAKYPEIGEAAYNARAKAKHKSYGFGEALRKGYGAGIAQSYEGGAQLADELGRFSKGLLGLPE